MARFRLEKWYLDVTDDNGSAFIGYAARLKWKLLNLSYSGFTFLNSAKKIKQRNSFKKSDFPFHNEDQILWKNRLCYGSWTKESESLAETLLTTADGKINWHCYYPKAKSEVQFDGVQVYGTGYVEFIELTILPWKLPIHQLHWGRFISPTDTIVWIRWIGPMPKTLIFHNGEKTVNADIQQEKISYNDFVLELRDSTPMRKGTLMNTVFSRFPSLAKLFPRAILQLRENKWCSTGDLYRNNKKVASGKAIHEVVEWK
jgi:hypothetical protein